MHIYIYMCMCSMLRSRQGSEPDAAPRGGSSQSRAAIGLARFPLNLRVQLLATSGLT